MSLAPIALFAYNRPRHLAQTLEALKTCPLASSSELHVFSDGSRHIADRRALEQVRGLIRAIEGFARVYIHEQTQNLGLSRSIIEGVTVLSKNYGRVIVLEDDIVVSPGFLSFMNQALSHFQDEPRVMQISGYMFPIETPETLGSTVLCRVPASWGWGTWERAWRFLESDSSKLLRILKDERSRYEFNLRDTYPYVDQLRALAAETLDVWGVRWYASMFAQRGLCLYPTQSLAQNIGMDGSGAHCGFSPAYDVQLSKHESWRFPGRIEESEETLTQIREFLLRVSAPNNDRLVKSVLERAWSGVRKLKRLAKSPLI